MSLSSGSSDEVLDAINALTTALDAATVDQQAMADEALRMRRARVWKDSWLAALPPAGQPNLVSLSTRALSSLSAATSRVRTSLARALRAEGLTVREIAAVFGVSHQRISELLARTPRPTPPPAPALTAPAIASPGGWPPGAESPAFESSAFGSDDEDEASGS